MRIGHEVDVIAGHLSRVLHGFRGPRSGHLRDLHRYMNLPPEQLFPTPPAIESMAIHRSLADRAVGASSLSWPSSHEVLCPRYRRRHFSEYSTNLTAHARWLRPERGALRRTCLLYVHGWLEPGSWVEEALVFPRWMRELDADVVHVSLPFHGKRNPRQALFSGEYFWTADLVRSFEAVRQSVCDARAMLGWLRSQGYERVGAVGASFGGAFVMTMACLEAYPDFIVPLLCHTQVGEAVENAAILWRVKRDLERWGVDAKRRRKIFDGFGIEKYAPKLAPNRQLWINARDDAHIDPAVVERQRAAWGNPPIHWIPGGHMTFPLQLPEITDAMRHFLETLPD